jgi:membrane-associated phospholipid phosphatase
VSWCPPIFAPIRDHAVGAGILGALVALVLFIALGRGVASRSSLLALDAQYPVARGALVEAAIFFTWLGYWQVLCTLGAAYVIAAFVFHWGVARAVVLVIMQGISQATLMLWKRLYRRDRPEKWLFRQERGFSYPSGHSATAMTFYFALLVGVSRLPLGMPWRIAGEALLAFCVIGLPWSRLALGAHYVTDVAGGLLYGAIWLFTYLTLAHLLHI